MKPNIFDRLGELLLGKGFYIVLSLCVATIGISGYYLVRSASQTNPLTTEPVTGSPTVVLPDRSAQTAKPPAAIIPKPVPSTAPAKNPDKQELPPAQSAPAQTPSAEQAPQPSTAPAAFTWPVKGEVLRGMSVDALRFDPTMGDWRTHEGVDLAADVGLEVLCVTDGIVTEVAQDDLMGTMVTVEHGGGLVSRYANLDASLNVSQGEAVTTGTVLGTVGATAIAESALPSHVHLELLRDGQAVDPAEYLPIK